MFRCVFSRVPGGACGANCDSPQNSSEDPELAVISSVSLCRAFCRLMGKGSLSRRKGDDEAQATVVVWLKDRYKDCIKDLCGLLNHQDPAVQTTALALLMRLVKEDSSHLKPVGEDLYFPHGLFGKIVKALVYAEILNESVKEEFVTKYLNEYDDIRYSFYTAVSSLASAEATSNTSTLPHFTDAALSFMVALDKPPTAETDLLGSYYAIGDPSSSSSSSSKKSKAAIFQKPAHRKLLQETWLSLLRLPLSISNTKSLLLTMSSRIAPTFTRPTLLMDFLVDAYASGGTTALLALNGLFYLISTKNLDYPDFYPALYALLTRDVLHVRYRSRFFRLLETFLGSTHLPAALIASFIKRLARLSLSAPPSAVVVIVPFVYNLLKKHPSCTFMVHREGTSEDREHWRNVGLQDCFDAAETDPMKTGALESCLWELEMGMTHWQPNVATIARIIGEQFTKERYGIEDFLDHSYASVGFPRSSENFRVRNESGVLMVMAWG